VVAGVAITVAEAVQEVGVVDLLEVLRAVPIQVVLTSVVVTPVVEVPVPTGDQT
jgi:hypothetical protein